MSTVITGAVVWYLSASLNDGERLALANSAGGVVTRGRGGASAARRLRDDGFGGPLWLDPVSYEEPDHSAATLFGDYWKELQEELEVAELISPGAYVGDGSELQRAIETQLKWLSNVSTGRLSLALHASWLTKRADDLIPALNELNVPLALAFADRNDPLAHPGAVAGLVRVLHEVGNVAILRSDLGAVGAAANGAALAAIGTSSTVRHVVPPGETGGGKPRDRTPSVFLEGLLDFKLGSHLDEYPSEASPTCDRPCCDGRALRRFNDEHSVPEARVHNRHAIVGIVEQVLQLPPNKRPEHFRHMCRSAEYAVDELASLARRPLKVRPQVKAWAALS